MTFHLPTPGRAKWIAIQDSQDRQREFIAGDGDDDNWYPAANGLRQRVADPISPVELAEILRGVINPG